MMKKNRLIFILAGLILSLLLASCGDKSSKSPNQNDTVIPDQVWYLGVGQFNGNINFGNLISKNNTSQL